MYRVNHASLLQLNITLSHFYYLMNDYFQDAVSPYVPGMLVRCTQELVLILWETPSKFFDLLYFWPVPLDAVQIRVLQRS